MARYYYRYKITEEGYSPSIESMQVCDQTKYIRQSILDGFTVKEVIEKNDSSAGVVNLSNLVIPQNAQLKRRESKMGWSCYYLVDMDGHLLNTEPVCTIPDGWHKWFEQHLDAMKINYPSMSVLSV